MKITTFSKKLATTLIAVSAMTSATAFAADCPSSAICRQDEAPGKYSGNGPYRVDSYTMPARSTPAGATVYFPENAQPPFSLVVFTPPFIGSQYMYRAWGPFFASHGIVTVTMDTTSVYDSVDSRASQQQTVLNAMKAENTRTGSPLQNKLDTSRFGAMGWSMGGGATWINSAAYQGLRSAMSLAGHNLSTFDSNASGRNTRIPTMLFNGAQDTTYLGGLGQSDGVYDRIPDGIAKAFYNVTSTGHFSWGSPTGANSYVAEMALAFQKAFLDGDLRWAPLIERPPRDVTTYEEANIPQS